MPMAPMMIVANEPTPEMPVMVAAMLRNRVFAPRVNTKRSLRSAWYALTMRMPPSVSPRRPVTSALILPRSRNSGRSLVKANAMPPPKQPSTRIAIAVSRQFRTKRTTNAAAPELAAHGDRDPRARLLRRRHGVRLHQAAAAVPGARQNQRRGDGTPGRDAGRHPHRQGVPRRAQ